MKKIALLYWRTGGNTENAAKKIYEAFNTADIDIFDVPSFDVDTIENYNLIILGGSTVGADHWSEASADNVWAAFFRKLEEHDLSGKSFALFGLGDQVLYPDHFVDDLGVLKEEADKVGARLIGQWPVEGYSFSDSEGVENNMFFGLALDEDNQPELTDERIKQWTNSLKETLGL